MDAVANDRISDAFQIPDKASGKKNSVYMRFTCRSAASAAMLRQAMEDRAAIDGIPVYSAFEDALMEASLPKDAFARRFTQLVLGEQAGVFKPLLEGVPPVQHALHDAFETLADTDNGFWRLPETKLLVSFASDYAEANDLVVTSTDDPDGKIEFALGRAMLASNRVILHSFASEYTGICDFNPRATEALGAFEASYQSWLEYRFLILPDLFQDLTEAWDEAWALPEVRDLVLAVLKTNLSHSEDSARDRKEFKEVCRAVMPAWSLERARRGMEMEEKRARAMTRSCAIKGGTLNYPTTWKIANLEEASGWGHAAKVSVVNAVGSRLANGLDGVDETTRIVLLPCPFEDIGDADEERSQRIIEMAAGSWPDLPRILDAKIELKRAENGKPLNWDEWKTSLRVSVSKVPEKAYDVSAAANGYAAWIDRDPNEDLWM